MQSFGRFVITRAARAALTIWLVISVVFILLLSESATPDQIEALRARLGLDSPIVVQYGRYWLSVVQGDLGQSLRQRQPALGLVFERLPATLQLAAAAFGLAAILGLAIGIAAALLRGTAWDRLAMALISVLQSGPAFFVGIVLILVFSVRLGWLPSSGRGGAKSLILPAVTLSGFTMASLARLARSALLDVLRVDYVRTARAKGLKESTVILRHALRNAALPLLTVMGLELGGLLTGAVITETVFAWPGVGRLAVNAVSTRDYPVVQASVLFIAAIFILINFLIDCSYALIDPRVRGA